MIFKNDKVKRIFSIFCVVIFCNLTVGCNYYRVRYGEVGEGATTKTIDRNDYRNNYYVLHVGDAMWEIKNFDLANLVISGNLATFSGSQLKMYERMLDGAGKRVVKNETAYTYQIHVYADSFSKDGEAVKIKEVDVTRIDIFDINQGLRAASVIGTGLLVGVGGLGLLIIVACATACPHVYVYNGETYYFNNSLFTGAVAPQLERDDFKLMPDYFTGSDKYQFYVKNEKEEEQYTNFLELMVVEHEKGTEVYPDQQGNINMVKAPIMPTTLKDDGGKDLTELVGYHDGRAFVFNNASDQDFSHVYAGFDLPENKANAKLVMQVKNTEWSGYVYHEFTKLFGSYYDNWVAKNQRKKSREEMEADQKKHGLPLVISVKKGDEWVDIEAIDLVGSISYNGLAVELPQELLNGDQLEVRIRSGFMFWKLDYLALDFSANDGYELQKLKPSIANGNRDKDFIDELSFDDESYMDHPLFGDSTYVEYHGLNVNTEKQRTLILHSKGYYIPLAEYDTKMDRKELAKFKADGELSRFSQELFEIQFGEMTLTLE
ncbi:MAG: hypothetical protein GQ574_11090 [Crocinitomix sp.]|nr:hypothetical protein [Crocinitomix sp.]